MSLNFFKQKNSSSKQESNMPIMFFSFSFFFFFLFQIFSAAHGSHIYIMTPPPSPPPSITAVQVEKVGFPATVKPPGSCKSFFLAGAGVRGLQIQGNFVKFTAIGVYVQDEAIPFLVAKWKGKTAQELADSVEFFRDFVTGPFEKFTQVTMILPLTGQQYAEKVSENCVSIWKSLGIYTEEEAKAIDKFISVFKDETFPPGSSILFKQSLNGSLMINFSKDGCIPEVGGEIIENKLLSESVLESIIGKNGVSPATRQSIATRFSELLKHY